MRKSEVVKRAEQFCRENNIKDYPVKIISLCKKYNISVFEKYLPEEVSGFIVIQGENYKDYGTGRLIVVNQSDVPSRRRFTIAHELAHYLLHRPGGDEEELFAHRDAGQYGGMETEANIFASNILMPKELVSEALSRLKADVGGKPFESVKVLYIAQEFAVSRPAAEVRLRQLGEI